MAKNKTEIHVTTVFDGELDATDVFVSLISQKYGKTNTKEYLAKKKDMGYNEDEVQKSHLLVGHSPALAQQEEQHLELEHPAEPQMLIHNGCRYCKRRPHIFKIDTVFQNPTVPFRYKHYVKSASFTLKKRPVSRLFTHKSTGGPFLLSFIRQGYYSTF